MRWFEGGGLRQRLERFVPCVGKQFVYASFFARDVQIPKHRFKTSGTVIVCGGGVFAFRCLFGVSATAVNFLLFRCEKREKFFQKLALTVGGYDFGR